MARLSNEQKKRVLERASFYHDPSFGRRMWGRVVGYDADSRGFGAVVVFPNGLRSFWGVNDNTIRPVNLGTPPPKPFRSRVWR
jgi:hypothetical protein